MPRQHLHEKNITGGKPNKKTLQRDNKKYLQGINQNTPTLQG
jgi:hypothetical protein